MIENFDGEFFQIQVFENYKWHIISTDYLHEDYLADFSNTGDCFKKLGFHGTFHRMNGVNALAELSKEYPKNKFRLIRRDVSWHTTVTFQNQ